MKLKSKLFASAVAFTMVLSLVAVPASAQTVAELTAQINALLAQIAQLQAQISGSTTGGASVTFTTDLTVGSTGTEVTALQQFLVGKGFLTMPAGVAYGYFGNLTKAALAAYQAANGISPAAGYFGPITRAKVNAAGGTTTGGTTTGSTGITTPGVEGTIAVTESSAGIVSTVYEGDDMAPVLGIKVEASNSDMAVQRFKFDLDETDSDTKFYNKIYKKIYITEGGNVLASSDLNSSTVVKDGDDYFVTLAGFNSIIPKGTTKTYVVKLDLYDSVDSSDHDTEDYTIALATNGVRAVDGAGIDQYGGTTSIAANPAIDADLTESATFKMSLNSSSPKKAEVMATAGSNENELDRLTLLVFDVKAEKDQVTVEDLGIDIDKAGGGAANASTTVYLYEGSTELDNASLSGSGAGGSFFFFSDLDYVIPKDTTKTFTVKADVRSANGTAATFTASASTTGSKAVVTSNSKGDSVTESGSATGYAIGVRNVGAEITLVSKSITTDSVPQTSGTNNISTSSLTASFVVRVKAVGGDIVLGLTQATNSPFFASTTPVIGSKGFKIYKNGSEDTTVSSAATSTSFTVPSTCTVSGASCTLAEGTTVDVPITLSILGRNSAQTALATGLYSVGIDALNWSGNTTNFMSGEVDWMTSEVSFP